MSDWGGSINILADHSDCRTRTPTARLIPGPAQCKNAHMFRLSHTGCEIPGKLCVRTNAWPVATSKAPQQECAIASPIVGFFCPPAHSNQTLNEPSEAETTGVGLKFRGGRPFSPRRLEKKISLHGRGCHFLEGPPIVQVVAFLAGFSGAVCSFVSAGHLVLQLRGPAFEDMAVMGGGR